MCQALCSVLAGVFQHRGGAGGWLSKEGASRGLEMGLGLSQDGAQGRTQIPQRSAGSGE